MPRSLESIPDLSLLTELLPEPDPLKDNKQRRDKINLVMWYIHLWQSDDHEDWGLALRIQQDVSLTPFQLSVIGEIKKGTPEPEILRRVTYALDHPYAKV